MPSIGAGVGRGVGEAVGRSAGESAGRAAAELVRDNPVIAIVGGLIAVLLIFLIHFNTRQEKKRENVRKGGGRDAERRRSKRAKDGQEEAREEPAEEVAGPAWYSGRRATLLAYYTLFLLFALGLGAVFDETGMWVIVLSVYLVGVLLTEIIWAYRRGEEARRLRPREAARVAAALAALARRPALDPRDDPRAEDGGPIEGPPEEEFWEKANRRLEFPLSTVATVLLHVLVAALLIYVLLVMENKTDQSSVPVKIMGISGMDDFGDGSAGSGGTEDPLIKSDADAMQKAINDSLPDPSKLPEVKEEIRKTIKYLDPSGNMPITDSNAAALNQLSESMRKKLLGGRQGAGNEAGTGFDGSKGQGPGGTGADSTLGRNMRWTLRFKVSSGRDYLEQLRAMGAKLLVPVPNSDKLVLVEDLSNPTNHRMISEDNLGPYAGLLKFADARREAVTAVSGTLNLDFTPKLFYAVFTKEIEADLAAKEKNYRNRRAEDIEETAFKVSVRGGVPEVIVDEQKIKK